MEGIELGKAISEYGIAIITGIFLVLVCWLIRYLIKEQSKNMKEVLGMVKVELKSLHKDGLKNANLNRKSISMLGNLTEYLNRHFNGCADKVNFKKKTNEKG
jgi:hypothetical protein